MHLKVIRGIPKIIEVNSKSSKINEECRRSPKDFRRLAKVAEDKPKILERFQRDCKHFRIYSKYFQFGPSSHSIPL